MNRLILIFFLIIMNDGITQQVPFYNHHFLNPFIYNPAYAGYNKNVNAYLVRNSRNKTFNEGSVNNYLSVEGALKNEKFGLGLSIAYQSHGILQQYGAGLSYSYKVKFNENNNLRIGLYGGFLESHLNSSAFNVEDVDDPFLQELTKSRITYNVSFGILYTWKSTRIGISIPQLIGNKINYGEFGTDNNRGFYQLERHYMLNVAQPFVLNQDENWSIIPNITLRYLPGVALQYDVMVEARNNKLGWVAAGYKSNYAIELDCGVRILDAFQVGYSYEYIVGTMYGYEPGMNHEILIGYTFKSAKSKPDNRIVDDSRIAELEKKNAELERTVSNNEQQLIDRNLMLEDSLARMNYLYRILEVQTEELLAEVAAYRESLNLLEAEVEEEEEFETETRIVPEDERVIRTTGYNFVDLKNSSAPSGYYLINGVYSSRSNAMEQLEETKNSGYPDAYLLLNKTNRFYYVILFYSTNDQEVFEERRQYVKKSTKKTWILEYFSVD